MGEKSILFYNWKRIQEDTDSNKEKITLVKNLIQTTNPLNKKWFGKSFILKPTVLLNFNNITTDEVVQILQIASTRNYFDYWFRGYTGILLDFCGVPFSKLKHNRFLKIDQKNRLIQLLNER